MSLQHCYYGTVNIAGAEVLHGPDGEWEGPFTLGIAAPTILAVLLPAAALLS